jgi:hypothetical protein
MCAFVACENKVQSVLHCNDAGNELEPFRSIMQRFLSDARSQLSEQEARWVDVRKLFHRTLSYFCVASSKDGSAVAAILPAESKAVSVPPSEAQPKDFFALWSSFVLDFKQLWRREHQRLARTK